MQTWLDYSSGRPSGRALAAAGITGVIRYVGISTLSKRLTMPEYDDLMGNGIQVHGVVEQWTGDADGGYSAGMQNASAAASDVATITRGAMLPVIYAANDKNTYIPADVDYVQAFADVFGHNTAGAYGFGNFLQACQGVCGHFWMAGHPPSFYGLPVDLWQRQGTWGTSADGDAFPTTMTVDGVDCDINNGYVVLPAPPVSPAPLPLPKDDDMFIRCQLSPATVGYAILSGPMFVGLGNTEIVSAQAAIKAGATVLDVGLPTWNELDKRSHELCDNPRPVTVSTPPVVPPKA